MPQSKHTIVPVILSGGSGTRLWPLSRKLRPKQFLPLYAEGSLFANTVERLSRAGLSSPMVLCNSDHRFLVAEIFNTLDTPPSAIILEPIARNTGPAILAAAIKIHTDQPQALMLVLPSDHVIENERAFQDAIHKCADAACRGYLATFGITPNQPEIGYGYIQKGNAIGETSGTFKIKKFVEKPDLDTASRYLSSGDYLWNSGMFLMSAQDLIDEAKIHCPDMFSCVSQAVKNAEHDLDFIRLTEKDFAQAPALSIDHGIMEKTHKGVVVPVDMGWNDIGSWSALHDIAETDDDDNAHFGDVILKNSNNCYVRSEKPLIAAVGVNNLIIVATDDAVLVTPKDCAQDVKLVVDQLAASNREEHLSHTTVYRPWGHYTNLESGPGFLVKRITVNPGARLSLQYHHHRAEHWVVVEGRARVTNGDTVFDLTDNQSTYIPVETRHRLENPDDKPLHIIEVQSGSYIGEDDIVRVEDHYGRD